MEFIESVVVEAGYLMSPLFLVPTLAVLTPIGRNHMVVIAKSEPEVIGICLTTTPCLITAYAITPLSIKARAYIKLAVIIEHKTSLDIAL